MEKTIKFTLNGKQEQVKTDPVKTLLKVLREDLNHTEVKAGCEQGECGTCTVILDGKIVNSCMVPVGQAEGRSITTVAGLSPDKELGPIQKAYIEEGAVQCGFCTPGLILATKALLDKHPHPTDEQIKEGISGNLCRCTGYTKIFNAIRKAAKG